MVKKKILIIGAGGHAKVVASVVESTGMYEVFGFTDFPENVGKYVRGYKIVACESTLESIYAQGVKYAVVGIGSIGDISVRYRFYKLLKKIGFILPPVVSPYAFVDRTVEIGEGTVIMHGAVIQPDAKIGKMVIVNTKASIDHDCMIGDFTHIAPGVTLSGGVRVGSGVHIGTGASVIQGIKIEKEAFIAAGAVVVKDVPEGVVAKGVPARW